MQKLKSQHILFLLFLSSVFLLALCRIEDTDAWMHLSLGKQIFTLKAFPAGETFVYTMSGKPFSYSSWLFGLIYYMSYLAFNIYGVILLKAITVTAAFYVLTMDSIRPHKNYVVGVIVMIMVVIMARSRFVERPDTFLMVFLSFSIFSLNAFIYDNKKYIYVLPVVHMLWANSHSSINLMFVPFLSFIVGGVLQKYINKMVHGSRFTVHGNELNNGELSLSQLKTIILIFILSFAASLVSPYFIGQYSFGAQVLASPWYKQEIFELKPPAWQTNKWPYIMTALTLVSFVLNRKRMSLMHLLLVLPFMALSFTAIRFIFLLGIVTGPVLARNLASYFDGIGWGRLFDRKPVIAVAAVLIILNATLTFANIGPFENKAKIFGFGINYDVVPEGALRYMDRKGITGRILNLFQWGGYIVWRDFPKRSVFVDPRGYIPNDLLEKMSLARANPSILDDLYKTYGFESILVGYPVGADLYKDYSDSDLSLSHPGWALVYWDDISLLYLKRGGKYDAVIKQDEYRFVKPANGIEGARTGLYDKAIRANIIAELKRNIGETGSSKAYTFIGFVYNETGLYRDAIEAFSRVRDLPIQSHVADAYSGIAYAYGGLGYFDEAIKYYKKSLHLYEYATTSYNIGIAYIKKGDKKAAIKYLTKALSLNSNLTSIYPQLIALYQQLGMTDKAKKTEELYERARVTKEGEEHFKNGMKAYTERNFELAAREFKQSIEANPSSPSAYSNLGYVFFDIGLTDKAYEYQKKAVDIDPNFANAHYGIALIYKKRGDKDMARKHWEEYLRIEPSGYFSRRAKEEIESLSQDRKSLTY